jgi:hypothetical protein
MAVNLDIYDFMGGKALKIFAFAALKLSKLVSNNL